MSSFPVSLLCFFLLLLRIHLARNPFDNLDLSTQILAPTVTGYKMTGNANSYCGNSMKTAGDINNDGYADIIVGADRTNTNQGVAYVIYGGEKSSFLDIDFSSTTLNPSTTGFMITGATTWEYLGGAVSTAGDINKDGYADIIVGSPGRNNYQGAAYVIYGGEKSALPNIPLSSTTLNPTSNGFKITGQTTSDQMGFSVGRAGDINNDGYDDIIVGAYFRSSNRGVAYVIYGGEKATRSNWDFSLGATLNPSTTGFMITGNAANDLLGVSVSTAGDINNDGYDDIIVGAYGKSSYRGVAYVIYGGPSMSNWDFSSGATLNPSTTGFTITGQTANDELGVSVSTAGDINNDGYDDIIVGADRKNTVYVIYGGEKSAMSNWDFSSGATLNPSTTGFTIKGNAAGDYFGYTVSTAGDINKDGYDDIIVGAYYKNSNQGAVYVIYGGPKSSMTNIDLSSTPLDPLTTGFMITGNAANDQFGSSVSTADINKDGYLDLLIGGRGENSLQGIVYAIHASCSMNCKQCSSESVCTTCKGSYLMYQEKCFASCPEATLQTSSTLCEDCPDHCKKCSTSTSVCDECYSPYILYQDKCLDSCPDKMFLSTSFTCEDCLAACSKCSSLYICSECVYPFVLYKSQCLTSCPPAMFISNNICKDCPSYCSSCISKDVCLVCYQGYNLEDSLCVLSSSSLQVQIKATQAIASATQGIGSVICVGSAVFPLSSLVSKIVQNTRYLNLSVTTELSEVYQTWQTDIISWDVPNVMSDLDHFKTAPVLFSQYDLGSPFLVNFWPTLINVGIGFGTFIACIFIQKVCEHEKYEGWAYSLVRKLVAGSFNFALIQAFVCLDDILFYLVLDAKTNPFNSFFSWATMICAVLFLAVGFLQVFFNFWTVYKYQGIKNQSTKEIEAFNEKNKYWELFYSDFNDDDLWSQAFFAIAIMRSVLSSFIITILYEYPLLQASYLIMMDVAIISFLYLKNPFNTLRGKLAQYYYEIITLLVHICAFILGLQDSFEKSSETVRKIMSTGILYLNTALISGAIGFLFIEIYETLRLKDKSRKKQSKSVPEDNQETQKLQSSETDVPKFNQEENKSSIEKFYFFPEDNQNRNRANSDFHLESSQRLETDFHVENSISSDVNQQRSQSPVPIMVRHRPQNRSQRQQRNNPRNPNYIINY